MSFLETIEQARAFLERNGRVSRSAVKSLVIELELRYPKQGE